jgi:hypothetical protein
MHVDISRRHYTAADGSVRASRRSLLRRSFRDGRGRPQKETLANLSDLPDEAIDAIRTILAGKTQAGAEFRIEPNRAAVEPSANLALTSAAMRKPSVYGFWS